MSAPSQHSQQAVHLKYGLLAAKSGGLIQALIERQPVDENGEEILRKAEQFLQEVASGANLVFTGVATGRASESLELLGYALSPIEDLQQQIKDRKIGVVFTEMASSIHEAQRAGPISAERRELLELAKRFFERLYVSLMSTIEHTRRQTANFGPFPVKSLVHG